MRHLVEFVAAVVVLVQGPAPAPAQQAGGWVGQRVITKPGTVLKADPKVEDDALRDPGGERGRRTVFRVYRVDRAEEARLWLVAEKPGVSGWVPEAQVVPYDRAIDFFTRDDPGQPERCGGLPRSRPPLARSGRSRQGHRRLQRGNPTRS